MQTVPTQHAKSTPQAISATHHNGAGGFGRRWEGVGLPGSRACFMNVSANAVEGDRVHTVISIFHRQWKIQNKHQFSIFDRKLQTVYI